MSREVATGALVTDLFPVYGVNGVKVTGLTDPANFTKSLWKNGVSDATAVTIVETAGATGDYIPSFTLATAGYWVLEIRNTVNRLVARFEYDVKAPVLLGIT